MKHYATSNGSLRLDKQRKRLWLCLCRFVRVVCGSDRSSRLRLGCLKQIAHAANANSPFSRARRFDTPLFGPPLLYRLEQRARVL